MPFLDAGALAADPDGLAFLKATIASDGTVVLPDRDAFVPKSTPLAGLFDRCNATTQAGSLLREDVTEPA